MNKIQIIKAIFLWLILIIPSCYMVSDEFSNIEISTQVRLLNKWESTSSYKSGSRPYYTFKSEVISTGRIITFTVSKEDYNQYKIGDTPSYMLTKRDIKNNSIIVNILSFLAAIVCLISIVVGGVALIVGTMMSIHWIVMGEVIKDLKRAYYLVHVTISTIYSKLKAGL